MKKRYLFKWGLILSMFVPSHTIEAEEAALTLSDLPFQGYYVTTSEQAIEGLLFEENQLYIYLNDHLHDDTPGQEWAEFLEEFHSFPHPDLKNYSAGVRERYLEEYDLAYDLQAVYQEIAEQITPEMSQADIQRLIDNRVPGIYYTHKNDKPYYQIARATVYQEGDSYQLHLFGEHLYTFESSENHTLIKDQDGNTYEYIPGINPY